MTGITASLNNLLSSILSLFRDLFNGIVSSLQSVGAVFFTLVQSVVNLAKDAVGFVLSNFLIIAVLGIAVVGFFSLQQRRGTTVTGQKKSM